MADVRRERSRRADGSSERGDEAELKAKLCPQIAELVGAESAAAGKRDCLFRPRPVEHLPRVPTGAAVKDDKVLFLDETGELPKGELIPTWEFVVVRASGADFHGCRSFELGFVGRSS